MSAQKRTFAFIGIKIPESDRKKRLAEFEKFKEDFSFGEIVVNTMISSRIIERGFAPYGTYASPIARIIGFCDDHQDQNAPEMSVLVEEFDSMKSTYWTTFFKVQKLTPDHPLYKKFEHLVKE